MKNTERRNHVRRYCVATIALLVLITGCETTTPELEDMCKAEELEPDFALNSMLGPMGDPSNWPDLPPDAIVASTYLRNDATNDALFQELVGAVVGELMAPAPGLMGLSLAESEMCDTSRTLSVWANEEALTNFVLGEAHMNAINRVAEVSRGGSITTKRRVSELPTTDWEGFVPVFAEHTGPTY